MPLSILLSSKDFAETQRNNIETCLYAEWAFNRTYNDFKEYSRKFYIKVY